MSESTLPASPIGEELPDPPISADVDIGNLDGLILNVKGLLAGDLWALSSGDEFKAAMTLMCRAWKQSPAGSLPDDDRILAKLSGYEAQWPAIREVALHGFIKCSDGRLYHPELCEDAKRAAAKQQERQGRTMAATAARAKQRDVQRDVPAGRDVTMSHLHIHKQEGSKEESYTPTESLSENPKPITRLAARKSKLGFEGKVIRLTEEDLEKWKSIYHGIPDISAELATLDAYYDTSLVGKERAKWFIRCSSALDKRHQDRVKAENDERARSIVEQDLGSAFLRGPREPPPEVKDGKWITRSIN